MAAWLHMKKIEMLNMLKYLLKSVLLNINYHCMFDYSYCNDEHQFREVRTEASIQSNNKSGKRLRQFIHLSPFDAHILSMHRYFNKICLSQPDCKYEQAYSVCTDSMCVFKHTKRIVCNLTQCKYPCTFLHFKGQRIFYPFVYELFKNIKCKKGTNCYNIYCKRVHPTNTFICFNGIKCKNHPQLNTLYPCNRNHPPL
jgi:hypothetical protein